MSKQTKKNVSRKQPAQRTALSWIPFGIMALTFILYVRVSGFDFLSNWDDESYIIRNADIQSVSGENIKKIFSSFYVSNYQPLTMLVFMIEFSLFKLSPGGYHVVNLLIHLINILLVFRLLQKWTTREHVVWIATALFALHPTRIESVAWISELKDVLYTTFFLLSLDYYTRYANSPVNRRLYVMSLLMFLLSCLSKSMAISLPVVLFLIDYWKGRKWELRSVLEKIPFLLLAVTFGVLALYTQSGKAMDVALKVGMINRILLVFYGVLMYFIKLVLPFNLAGIHYYPVNADGSLPWLVYLSPLLIAALLTGLWLWKPMRRVSIFGFGFFIITIGMVLQLVPFGHAIIAERYTYVPYIGLFFFIAWFLDEMIVGTYLKALKTSALYIAFGLLAVFALISSQRLPVWKNSMEFYGDLVKKYPDAAHAHWMRGNVLKEYNQTPQALESYNRTIELDSGYAMAWFNRGVMRAAMKQYREAVSDYDQTIRLEPDYYPAYHNRGNSLREMKETDAALESFGKALSINPQFENSLMARGELYIQLQNFDKAIADYDSVLSRSRNPQALYNRGLCRFNTGMKDKACEDWRESADLKFEPSVKAVETYCK